MKKVICDSLLNGSTRCNGCSHSIAHNIEQECYLTECSNNDHPAIEVSCIEIVPKMCSLKPNLCATISY
jgi:hypothetical protein